MTPPPTATHRLRSIVGGSLGNLIEWYDWYTYAACAIYFAPSFFPKGDPTSQLLDTAAVFAVGFLMRPLGGWWFGRLADARGRRVALTRSVLLMCAGSALVALTPTHATIGVAAPAVLLIARMLQGLSVGGEYGTSATYLSEMAGARHRGFWSSFQYVTLIGGQLLALGVLIALQHLLPPGALEAWGWRIPFALGAVGALAVLRLRTRLDETKEFVALETGTPRGTLPALLRHPREVLTVMGLTLGGTLAFYTLTTYAQKLLVNTAGFTKDSATRIAAGALLVFVLVQPLVGWLSDRRGRRPLLLAFAAAGTLGTVPLLGALGAAHGSTEAFLLLVAGLLGISGYTAINAVVKAELFPAEIRALGVGLPYAVTVALFGGTAEYVALWARQQGHEEWFAWYVTACIACSGVTYLRMPEPQRISRMAAD